MPAVYLDHHATTPVDPRVLEAMLPYFTERFGNASSRQHRFGWTAGQAVDKARREVAELIGADPREVVFTSGATESINLALKGAAEAYAAQGDRIVTAATEHKAVLDVCASLERRGYRIARLPVSPDGLLDPAAVEAALTERTILVSLLYANNEIGAIQPIRAIGSLCRARGVLLHADLAQAAGKIPVDVHAESIDLASLSGHKLYGPKGIGALYVRSGVRLAPQMEGGGHERGLRSGTLNVPGIVGLGAACRIAASEMAAESARLGALRDGLLRTLTEALEGVHVNGSLEHRLPHNLNLSFDGVDAASLLTALPEVALSSGSACTSANPRPSHVLEALGLPPERAQGAIRIGLGRFTTPEEVDYAAARIIEAVRNLRDLSPVYALSQETVRGQ
jgi:cysteine desulfurase